MFEPLSQKWLNETRRDSAPRTTARRLTSLRAFARWAKWATDLHEYMAPSPGKPIPHPIPERLEGLERMLAVAGSPDQEALIGACGFTGMRISEALDMQPSWLDPHEMTMTIRGKGDKVRVVPVSPRAWSAMSTSFARAFATGSSRVIAYQDRSARQIITSMGRRAGLRRPVASHDLRATYATILSDNGVPPRVIQELLGHTNLTTTEIYMGVQSKALREAVDF